MTIAIKVLLLSIMVALAGYCTILTFNYLRGKFQYSILFPGGYIIPDRIRSAIKTSVIDLYIKSNHSTIQSMGTMFQQHLLDNKIPAMDATKIEEGLYKYKLSHGELGFKYFIVMYRACVVGGLLPCSTSVSSSMEMCKHYVNALNVLAMSRHLKKFISNSDRSIILADVLYRNIANSDSVDQPYNSRFYRTVRRDKDILKYEELIINISKDPEVVKLIRTFFVPSDPVHRYGSHAITLTLAMYVCLYTHWLD